MAKKIITVYLLALLMGCVKPYDFDPLTYEKVLVIDGLITDQPGPQTVAITYTYPLDTTLTEKVQNAEVWVEDGDGNRTDYTWFEDGIYRSPAGFTGVVGQSYQLHIEMPDGSAYTSSEELLIKAPEIDSIHTRYARLPTVDEDKYVGGMQFFVDAHDETGRAQYFRYEWEETYKIEVLYPELYVLIPEDSTIVPKEDPLFACYQENASTNLMYATTIGSVENRIAEFPIRFVSEEGADLVYRYSILVRQFTISEAAYLFYKRLRENNESGGSLFDQQTGSVFGNIASTDNPDQAVLGFFEVSGVSAKRRFFDNAEFDDRLHLPSYRYCLDGLITVGNTREVLEVYDSLMISGYIYYYSPFAVPPQIGIQSTRSCSDCSYYADPIEPEYWID